MVKTRLFASAWADVLIEINVAIDISALTEEIQMAGQKLHVAVVAYSVKQLIQRHATGDEIRTAARLAQGVDQKMTC
jgi:hypothetical protein